MQHTSICDEKAKICQFENPPTTLIKTKTNPLIHEEHNHENYVVIYPHKNPKKLKKPIKHKAMPR
jgi:hypothetical protein